LQAALSVLAGAYRLGKRSIQALAHDLLGLSVSTGMIAKLERGTGRALEQPVAQAHEYARGQPANVDETSWRQQRRRHWLWGAVPALVTVSLTRPRRSAQALREVVGRQPQAVITSDRLKSYEWLPLGRRQVCWAHPRRDFQAMIDRGGPGQPVGRDLL